MSIERYGSGVSAAGGAILPFSKAVRAGDFVFVSGQIPMGPDGEVIDGGIVAQTEQTIANVRTILESAGCGLADVVKVTVWLQDVRDFGSFNRVYAKHFGAALPARSCVEARLMSDCKVEIEAMAYKPKA
jgi:reactive intermediate/imine deaminase